MSLTNRKVTVSMKSTIYIQLLAASILATSAQAANLFVNFGKTAVEGWTQVTQTSGANLNTTVSDSSGGSHSLAISCGGGNMTQGNYQDITSTWGTGNFNGASSSLADMSASIGLEVGENVWNTGLANGGVKGLSLVIGGYTAGQEYDIFLIAGSSKGDNLTSNTLYSWALDSSNATESTTVQYDFTGRTGEDLSYNTLSPVTGTIKTGQNVAYLIKMTNVIADASGNITIKLDGGERAALNALVIQDVDSVPEPATATLSLLGLGALLMRRRRA